MMSSWLILEFTESDQCVDLDKNSPRLVPSKTFSVDCPVYPDGGMQFKNVSPASYLPVRNIFKDL